MISFCGKKCKCKRRCKGYFPNQPDLERGCSKACDSNRGLDRETYLCSGQYVDQVTYMLSYGHDPCPNDEIRIEDVLDPLNSREQQEENNKRNAPIYLGLGIMILVALGILGWSLTRK